MFRFKKSLTIFVIFCIAGGFLGFMLLTAPRTTQAVSISGGDLIKASTAAVYYYGSDGGRYCFPNAKTYFTWYDDFSGVETISDAELATIPLKGNVAYKPGVRMVKITTDPKVYAVDAGGTLRWVTSEAAAISLYGSDWNTKIDDIPDPFFVNYTMGADISSADDFDRPAIEASASSIDLDKGLTGSPAGDEETPGLPGAPVLTAPTSATPGISFALSWTAPATALTYTLQKSTSLSFTSPTAVYSGSGTSATDSINATSYYRARAQNATGSGAWSSVKTVDTGCPVLLAPTLSVSETSGTSLTVSWTTISGATSYSLERDTNSSFTDAASIALTSPPSTGPSQSIIVSGDVAYYYRVRANNACGPGAWSNAGTAQVTTEPADACTIADACANRSTGSVYRCNSSGIFSTSGDHYCECQADDSARISCAGDTTIGGICVVDNACFGSGPGSTYRCNSSGAFSTSGDHYCECQTDCTVYVSQESDVTLNNTCVVNNACFGSSPGSGHRCDETGYFNINGAYWCTCESDCSVSGVCEVADACANRSTGSVYRCDSSGTFSSTGSHYCECQADDSARISCPGDTTVGGICVVDNACFGSGPGSTYRCNSSGTFSTSGDHYCECQTDCTVYVSQESDITLNNTCVVNNACFGSSPGSGHRCDETGYFNINGAYWCTCESDCSVSGVCEVADACANRSTGSVYRCNSSGIFSTSGDHYCECQADDSARISCPGDTTVGGICVVDNACFGSGPGSVYRCDSSGTFSTSGDHYCECQTDCTVYVSQESDITLNNTCVVNNACFGSSPGSGHRCDETGYFNINGAYWCTCENDCIVACTVENACANRSTGSVYRCDSSGIFSTSGSHYCECQADNSARISCAGDFIIGGTCVLSNGCFGRSPGSGYRCNSSGYFDLNGSYWCTCSSGCTVTF